MRRFRLALGILLLFAMLGGCIGGKTNDDPVLIGSNSVGHGEQPVSTKDFELPNEPGPELIQYFSSQKDFMREGRYALRIPYGIKKIFLLDGQILVQSFNNQIWSLDSTSLIVEWTWSGIVGELAYAPAVNNFSAYFIARDRLYSVDRSEGFERWRYDLPFPSSSAPASVDNYVYIGGWDGRLYCVVDDIRNGGLAWYHQVGDQITTTPMVATILRNTWVHTVSDDGHYMKFRPDRIQSNPHAKMFQIENGAAGEMATDGNLAFIASPDYNVYAMHPLEGPKWVFLSENRCMDGCVVQDDIVYARNEKTMLALNAKTGERLWDNELLTEFIVKLKRYSYFKTVDGRIVGVDNETLNKSGKIAWSTSIGPFDYVLHSPDEARLFVATESGYILSYEEHY